MDVRKAFLGDTVQGGFRFDRQPPDLSIAMKVDFDAASLRESRDQPSKRGHKSYVGEQGRVENIRDRADLAQRKLVERLAVRQDRQSVGLARRQRFLDQREVY